MIVQNDLGPSHHQEVKRNRCKSNYFNGTVKLDKRVAYKLCSIETAIIFSINPKIQKLCSTQYTSSTRGYNFKNKKCL